MRRLSYKKFTNSLLAAFDEAGLIDHADGAYRPAVGRGDQLLDEDGLDLALDVGLRPGGIGEETLHGQDPGLGRVWSRCVDPIERHGFDALASVMKNQSVNIAQRMLTRFRSAEERCKSIMESNQILSRGAQQIRGHDRFSVKSGQVPRIGLFVAVSSPSIDAPSNDEREDGSDAVELLTVALPGLQDADIPFLTRL